MTSTNALTARYCAAKGWPCETVQTWRGTRRHDLFGIADSIALAPGEILFIQNCSYGTLKAHRDAIVANGHRDRFRDPPLALELWEWRKRKVGRRGLWFLRKQRYDCHLWSSVSDWEGPLDLYPKKP